MHTTNEPRDGLCSVKKRLPYTILFETTPTYLTIMLGVVLQRVIHWRVSQESLQDNGVLTTEVFDLVNCGPNHRFKTANGFVAHNCLGLGYGMGPRKMVNAAYDAGYIISFAEAKEFHRNYWQLFAGLKTLSDRLAAQRERDGYVINPFGYRSVAEPRKAFNAFIQSSVSGIMHVYLAILTEIAPYAKLVTCIHDELLMSVPDKKLTEFKAAKEAATEELNTQLQWSVKVRTGWALGKNWYDAK